MKKQVYVASVVIVCLFIVSIFAILQSEETRERITRSDSYHYSNLNRWTEKKMKVNLIEKRSINELSQGVLDRFEGNQAIILLEDIGEELVLPEQLLPEASMVDTVFSIYLDGNELFLTINQEKYESELKESRFLLNQLRQK